MRNLIPFDVSALGLAEWAWLLLALGGLSLLAPPKRPRILGAILTALFLVGFGLMYGWGGVPEGQGQPSLAQKIVMPILGAAAVLMGSLRRPLERKLGTNVLALTWLATLGLVSLVMRPFDLQPVKNTGEWIFLALNGVALAATIQDEGWAGRMFRRVWWIGAIAYLLLCEFAAPFGLGLWAGIGFLVLYGMVFGVLTQGRELRLYVKRRLIGTPMVLFLLLTISFFLIRAAPGGPFQSEKGLDPAIQKALEAEYGLSDPLHVQFGKYIERLVWKGDMGSSFKQKDRTVNEIIGNHIGPSAVLGLSALCIAILFGVSTGLVSGIARNSIFDYASMSAAMVGLALPTFVVGPMLVLLFAMKLDWAPVTGWGSLRDLILPAITLALPFAARVARLTRAGMLEVVHQDYIRTARAKGLSERAIVIRHTLKGALIPVVSFLGPAVAQMLTGSLVVEMIFGVPGIGKEFVNSAINRDYTLVLGLVLLFGSLLIFFTLLVDILYAFLDPRIRHG